MAHVPEVNKLKTNGHNHASSQHLHLSFMVLAHVAFGKLNAAWLIALNEFIRLLVPKL